MFKIDDGLVLSDVDARLLPHNLHWSSAGAFREQDPALRRIAGLPVRYRSPLIDELPLQTPGIYAMVGGRQVGKSTLLKQVMAELLESGVAPERVAYVTCEPFVDREDLRRVLSDLIVAMGGDRHAVWLLVDEVTYVRDWDRAVKFLADAGALERCFLLVTGSDHIVIQDSLKQLPGRRGRARQVEFHLHPLSFLDWCRLPGPRDRTAVEAVAAAPLAADPAVDDAHLAALEQALRDYHVTGGFLPAINDLARDGVVAPATRSVYSDWIRGDLLRLDRSERYLREVLSGIHRRYGSQVTWNSLCKELSIDHPKTVSDYVGILERIDAAVVVPALAEHRRGPAPKKARKLFFADPFVHGAIAAWLGERGAELTGDELLQRDLEATFAAHVRRFTAGYYVKGAGEIDVAWYDGDALQLVEVKWSTQLRPAELKEIRRRGHGVIAARVRRRTDLDGVTVLPAAVVLLRLAAGRSSCPADPPPGSP